MNYNGVACREATAIRETSHDTEVSGSFIDSG